MADENNNNGDGVLISKPAGPSQSTLCFDFYLKYVYKVEIIHP